MHTNTNERVSEYIDCRNCDQPFDLMAQHYYSGLCPTCHKKEHGAIHGWISCVACETKLPRKDVVYAMTRGRNGTERLPVCSEGCKECMETPAHAPHGPDMDRGDNPYYGEGVTEANRLYTKVQGLEDQLEELTDT